MYQQRFGLHRKPFQTIQFDSDYFPSEAFRELEPIVRNTVRSDQGIAVLTGPAGVGKTVTLEAFRRSLQTDTQTLFLRGGTIQSTDELLYALNRHLAKSATTGAMEPSGTGVRRWEVVEKLQRGAEFWGPLTLLVDDIHLVQLEVFAELRTLLEEEVDGKKLVRLLVSGPLSLEETLAEPAMGDFARRIRSHVFLQPLRTPESVSYLRHQLTNAGGTLDDIFTTTAIESVVTASGGLPRCLNLLADETLMICEESDLQNVTPDTVKAALSRLQHLPVVWNAITDEHDDSEWEGEENTHAEATVEVVSQTTQTESLSAGVIEIGAPAPVTAVEPPAAPATESPVSDEASCVVETSDQLHGDVDHESFLAEEPDAPICEFVADDLCDDSTTDASDYRDANVVETISQLTYAIEDVEGYEEEAPVDDLLRQNEPSAERGSEDFTLPDVTSETLADIDHLVNQPDGALEVPQQSMLETWPVDGDRQAAAVPLEDFAFEGTAANVNSCELSIDPFIEEVAAAVIAETDMAEGDDSHPDAQDLEHHLLLATATDTDPCDQVHDNEALFAQILADGEAEREAVDGLFTSFTPWQPAGEWPPVVADIPQHQGLYATQLGDSTPIFDRYTWCELGRSVAAEAPVCRHATDTFTAAEWPPVLDGVVPPETIPITVSDAPDEAGDLQPVVGVRQHEMPPTKESYAASTEDSFVNHDSPADRAPEDEITEEREPTNSETLKDTAVEAADSFWDRIPLVDDEPVASGGPTRAEPAPLSGDNGGSGNQADGHDSTDVAAVIANAVQRYIADAGHDVISNDLNDNEEVEVTEVGDTIKYAPRLLQTARTRLVASHVGQQGLRQAAGAENSVISEVPDDTREDGAARPQLSIARPSDTESPADTDFPSDPPATGFRNLFTRLRKMRTERR